MAGFPPTWVPCRKTRTVRGGPLESKARELYSQSQEVTVLLPAWGSGYHSWVESNFKSLASMSASSNFTLSILYEKQLPKTQYSVHIRESLSSLERSRIKTTQWKYLHKPGHRRLQHSRVGARIKVSTKSPKELQITSENAQFQRAQ